MKRIAKFHKVSYEQFEKDWMDEFPHYPIEKVREIYDAIKLPKRATSGSAGYDFFMPMDYNITINASVKIPTGIRCEMKDGWVLKEYPRTKLHVDAVQGICKIKPDFDLNKINIKYIYRKIL